MNALRAKAEASRPVSGKRSGDVVLIPKPLRMEWTDALALDPDLPHAAFRVACVIGSHFNRHRGDAYPKQETIARIMGVSKRTVESAIAELERRGYLIVKRRELGHRKSDGRRVCGGRGVSNSYLPAFERSQVTATNTGRKLADRCDLYWEERSQNSARKVATDCDPTLTPPSGENPTRTHEPSRTLLTGKRLSPESGAWSAVGERLRKKLGDDVFDSWFGHVHLQSIDGPVVTLTAGSKFFCDYIRNNFGSQLLACWQAENRRIERFEIRPRQRPEEGA